jgi:hypothetical protein
MKMDFFGEGTKISSMRVFYATIVGWQVDFISLLTVCAVEDKTVIHGNCGNLNRTGTM